MGRVLFANSGSEANDTAIKLAWYVNNALGRPQQEEDHLAAARVPRRDDRDGEPHRPCVRAHRLRPADRAHPAHRCAVLLSRRAAGREPRKRSPRGWPTASRQLILREDPDTVAAFFAEPVMGAGGVIVPPATYFERIQPILQQVRHPVRRRRSDLRLRPHRQHVRHADVRPASPTSSPSRRRCRPATCRSRRTSCRTRSTTSCSRKATSSASSATATRTRRIRCRRRSRSRR